MREDRSLATAIIARSPPKTFVLKVAQDLSRSCCCFCALSIAAALGYRAIVIIIVGAHTPKRCRVRGRAPDCLSINANANTNARAVLRTRTSVDAARDAKIFAVLWSFSSLRKSGNAVKCGSRIFHRAFLPLIPNF